MTDKEQLIDCDLWKSTAVASEKRVYVHPVLRAFLKAEAPNKRVLDIGCGTGEWCAVAAEYGATLVEGIDINQDVVKAAQQTCSGFSNVHIQFGDQYNMPYGDNSFDVVVSCFSICYSSTVELFKQYFAELYRVLSPGGKCIIVNIGVDKYKTLYLEEGTDEAAAEAKIKKILQGLPSYPTKEQINEALNTGSCSELFSVILLRDENGRMYFAKDGPDLLSLQQTWHRYVNCTFLDYYFSKAFTIEHIEAAGLKFERFESTGTEERRLAYNSTNPPFKHSKAFSKYSLSDVFYLSKPL